MMPPIPPKPMTRAAETARFEWLERARSSVQECEVRQGWKNSRGDVVGLVGEDAGNVALASGDGQERSCV